MAVNYQKVVIRVGLLSWQKLFLPEQWKMAKAMEKLAKAPQFIFYFIISIY